MDHQSLRPEWKSASCDQQSLQSRSSTASYHGCKDYASQSATLKPYPDHQSGLAGYLAANCPRHTTNGAEANSSAYALAPVGLATINQPWIPGNVLHGRPLSRPLSGANAAATFDLNGFDPDPFVVEHQYAVDQRGQSNFQLVQGAVVQAPRTGEAVVMESPFGGFFCSEPGCNATYLRVGDCRRHLKKHNGPFFPCTERGCRMEFYRHDKLRAHMKQGHGITVPVPGNRRRQRGVTAH